MNADNHYNVVSKRYDIYLRENFLDLGDEQIHIGVKQSWEDWAFLWCTVVGVNRSLSDSYGAVLDQLGEDAQFSHL